MIDESNNNNDWYDQPSSSNMVDYVDLNTQENQLEYEQQVF